MRIVSTDTTQAKRQHCVLHVWLAALIMTAMRPLNVKRALQARTQWLARLGHLDALHVKPDSTTTTQQHSARQPIFRQAGRHQGAPAGLTH